MGIKDISHQNNDNQLSSGLRPRKYGTLTILSPLYEPPIVLDNIGKFSCKSKYIYAFHFRTHLLAEIMEATRNDEYSIFNSYACIPKNILHNATSLHASKNMLNDDS